MNRLQRAATGRLGLLAMLALIAGSGLTPVASAQEIMLERVGAVRMAAPGELERNEEWLQKAFRGSRPRRRFACPPSRARMTERCSHADARRGIARPRDVWSGLRESNPRMKLGKLPFYH